VRIGCGWTALAILVIGFAAGAVVVRTGVGRLMDMLLGTMEGEIVGMYGKDVVPAQRAAFEAEMAKLRANLRAEKVSVAKLDPVMSDLRDASSDKVITPAEIVKLTQTLREANTPKPASQPKRPPVVRQPNIYTR
jgi:hypothetical protein